MPSTAAMSATTAMKTSATMEAAAGAKSATMGSASKARLSARRKASDISAVIKATERAGVRSLLSVGK